ncbi:orotidine 5'-phosphate decarboxylase [Neoasaia chiangmaiensis NBRC 101099]|uniref:Orotidine 5'-phosphate decarboxylase n=1 Tax=Neoasaia chiangmaiensis TaxID=320497 RepID=A0A1U9KPE6_9PROT|nr:orotidine-5'-phosphate decarboxylase [Neoasaia chiangmaiensis]AQS87676.1 orotidine 5'-phosphate decarboxylase [Neoasaia chiangmaiensis]GBR41882.1 orotidine 5'-phosphate decarboxylase [Neoasaia chiangmaiensis NBRC 101099]GEN14260.1 orotidine 5'-phosphate decarboxylase [Neoasaia chiangmaiensis]
MAATRLIVALDTQDMTQARQWATQLDGHVDAIKLGMEFTYAQGLDAIRQIADGRTLFLDLKLHDIPNTVAKGLTSLAPLQPAMLTIHASGGREMIRAAREAVDAAYPADRRPLILAVTVLTSMDAAALHDIGIDRTPQEQVVRLGQLAIEAGADGLVCSAQEIAPLRNALGRRPVLVVPGIRPAGSASDDQKRIMTPAQAARAGADWIVVGRPITRSPDPTAAASAIQAELADA